MIPAHLITKIKRIEIKSRHLVQQALKGKYQSAFKGHGLSFEEVREYQLGDDVRQIDWNTTARMLHPYVKKFTEERQLTVIIAVDLSGSGLFGSTTLTKRELAAEIASVLAFAALFSKDRVGLILFTDTVECYIPPAASSTHVLHIVYHILSYTPKHKSTNLTNTLNFICRTQKKKAIVIILTDLMGQTHPTRQDIEAHLRRHVVMSHTLYQTPLAALKQAQYKHELVVIQLVDRYEIELPSLGRLVLKDAETGEVVEVNSSDPRKRTYFTHRQLRAQAELRELFKAAGIDLIQIRTDQDYLLPLVKFLRIREKRRYHG